MGGPGTDRRRLLLAGMAAAALPSLALADTTASQVDPTRALKLYNPHTDERFDDAYFADGAYIPDALVALDRFCRDFREDKAIPMDQRVYDIAWALAERYRIARGIRVTVRVHSAYRTKATNEALRPEGAARNSLHMAGKALDLSVDGFGMRFLANHARRVATGGLGLYWRGRFVHLDTGPARTWFRRI